MAVKFQMIGTLWKLIKTLFGSSHGMIETSAQHLMQACSTILGRLENTDGLRLLAPTYSDLLTSLRNQSHTVKRQKYMC